MALKLAICIYMQYGSTRTSIVGVRGTVATLRERDGLLFFASGLAAVLISVRSYRLLYSLPGAAGFDGYYYVLQVDSILHTGFPRLHTLTPAALYILAFFVRFIGNSISGIKIAIIVGAVCLFVLVGLTAYRDCGNRWAALRMPVSS
jgi:hypothetical protein